MTAASVVSKPLAVGRKSSPFALAAGFIAVSFALALVFLAFRNLYDDEFSSLNLAGMPLRSIVHIANTGDVHPPGMYVLAHLAYLALPSARWMTVAALLFVYAGLASFVFAFVPLLATTPSRICFLLLATLHPQLMMWSDSIRWYGWWTGIALFTLVVALEPRQVAAPPRLGYGRAQLLGLLLGCLFYINYVTLIFAASLGAAMLLRYSRRVWRQGLTTIALFVLLIAPQLRPFLTVHMAAGQDQRSHPVIAAARLVQSLSESEAYVPWHPLAIGAMLVFLLFASISLRSGASFVRKSFRFSDATAARGPIPSLIFFALIFFALIVLSGLGGKPRNGLLLVPVLAPVGALALGKIRPRAAQYGLMVLLAAWSATGIMHLIGRQGVSKAGMNSRPEDVIDFVRDTRGANCSVLVTSDPSLAFVAQSSGLNRLLVLTTGQISIYRGATRFAPGECPGTTELYVVKSHAVSVDVGQVLAEETSQAEAAIAKPARMDSFGFDPDARIKRKLTFLPGTADLPDYRYIVYSGSIGQADMDALERSLVDFTPADGWSRPKASVENPPAG